MACLDFPLSLSFPILFALIAFIFFFSLFERRHNALHCVPLACAHICLFTVVRLGCESDENEANYDRFVLFRL